MTHKVKVRLAEKNLTLEAIAQRIGRSGTLVSFILDEKHMGWEHRAKIRALLGLSDKEIWPNTTNGQAKKRRAA